MTHTSGIRTGCTKKRSQSLGMVGQSSWYTWCSLKCGHWNGALRINCHRERSQPVDTLFAPGQLSSIKTLARGHRFASPS